MQRKINFDQFFDGMVGYNETLDDHRYYMVVIEGNLHNISTEAEIDDDYLNDDYEDEAQELVDNGDYDNLEDAIEFVKENYEDSFYYDYVKDFDVRKRKKIIKILEAGYDENERVKRQIDALIDDENVLSFANFTSKPALTAASIHLQRSGIPKDLRKVIIGSLDRREPIKFYRPSTLDNERNEFNKRLQKEAALEEDEFRQRQHSNREKRLRENLQQGGKRGSTKRSRRSRHHSHRSRRSRHRSHRSRSRRRSHRSRSRRRSHRSRSRR